jgi:hypothetical protein
MELLYNQFELLSNTKMVDLVLEVLADSSFQKWALDLIRIEQLYKKGERGDGVFLGNYSSLSLTLKTDTMLDHITLKETGDFYNTFTIKLDASDIIINADGDKPDKNLFDIYDSFGSLGDSQILSFNEENFKLFSKMLTEKIIKTLWD